MLRSELCELHYIAPIVNVPSILLRGILSKRRAEPLNPASVAMQELQDIRAVKVVPGGLPLHHYVNLYVHARNPMLYKRRHMHLDISVLTINSTVLDLPGVVIADGNAGSKYTAFYPSDGGLDYLDRELVFAESWNDEDQIVRWRKARVKCAEVLVPDRVEPRYIIGAYVSCHEAQNSLRGLCTDLDLTIDPHLFFRLEG